MTATVRGRVFTRLSEAKRFTELPWVKKLINEKLGFDPYPGTLNLTLPQDVHLDDLLDRFKSLEIPAQKEHFPGRLYRALIMGRLQGAVVRPEVPGYPENVLEIVAPLCPREQLHLRNGDEVEVEICPE